MTGTFAVLRTCPQCSSPLQPQGSALVCSQRACGEWVPASALRGLVVAENVGEVTTFLGFPEPQLRCCDCRKEMEGFVWNQAVFRRCPKHGAWVESWVRARFHALLAADDERERVIRALAESLSTEEGRLELARRILSLERRVSSIENK